MATLKALVLAILLAGCVSIAREPALPMPPRPAMTFTAAPSFGICLSDADADLLLKYFQKLDAFDEARQRIRK